MNCKGRGHVVFEALAVSETLALAEQHPSAAIIIDHDVQPETAEVIQQHYPTLNLNATATVAEILWELNQDGKRV